MNAKAIIGASAGDEGKGLVTDYYTHQATSKGLKTLVILNNGGPQRSHTVSLLNGTRHAFRHFGSGTFAGADTYLSEFFIVNPMVFAQEYKELEKFGFKPTVFIDRKCRITTPYEMYLNQMLEESRGENKHGSCGMGIWETVRLYDEIQPHEYRWGQCIDLSNYSYFKDGFVLNRKATFNMRLKEYQNNHEIDNKTYLNWSGILNDQDKAIIEKYKQDLTFMMNHCIVCDAEIIKRYDEVIIENGQGLLLNDDPDNVHTTPSNTGMTNIRELEEKLDFHTEPIYVSRSYLTRHGADPRFVDNELFQSMFYDETNVPNQFQGKIRYSTLDNNLIRRIKEDASDRDFTIVFTHMNELWLPDYIREQLWKVNKVHYSVGKERESVQ